MPTPLTTPEAFLELLDRSGLAARDQVVPVLDAADGQGLATPLELARTLVQGGVITRYQAERLLEGRSRGFFIDQFRILELLGAGGMSFMYLALDQTTGVRVALKVVSEKHRADPGMLTRLKLEARAGQKLSHPNIIRTFGIRKYEDVFGEIPYLVMEFVEGINLEELLQMRGRVPWRQACDFGRQAADGLRASHRAGIIHRDVKPGNLLVDRQGEIRLLDFGLALLESREDADEFSLAMIFGHDCLGTADFIAPEQTRDSFSVDARADVYSLGCTLYTLLAGQLPFPDPTSRQKIEAHRSRVATPLRELVPELPAEAAGLIARMMAKSPADRPASMGDVSLLLSRLGERAPVAFDFPRVLAYRASQARARLASLGRSSVLRGSGAGSSGRALSHVNTSSTRKLPHVQTETAVDDQRAEPRPPVPVALSGDEARVVPEAGHMADGLVLIPQNGGPNIPLRGERVLIGRHPDCDVVLSNSAISGHHCELRQTARGWVMADLGSKNGVQVNNRLLLGAGDGAVLQPGDLVLIGRALKYRLSGGKETASTTVSRRWWLLAAAVLALLALGGGGFWFLRTR